MMSLWNRLLCEIFYWDLTVRGDWATEIFDLLEKHGFEEKYFQKAKVVKEDFKYQVQNIMGISNHAKAKMESLLFISERL